MRMVAVVIVAAAAAAAVAVAVMPGEGVEAATAAGSRLTRSIHCRGRRTDDDAEEEGEEEGLIQEQLTIKTMARRWLT